MKYKNILLIDDDEDDQDLFLLALKELQASIKFVGFYDALLAFNKLVNKEISPDAIFLDLNMPIINGFQFLSLLKKTDELKNIPIIIYSTSSQENMIKLAKENGAHDFITKPSKFRDLVNILRTTLS